RENGSRRWVPLIRFPYQRYLRLEASQVCEALHTADNLACIRRRQDFLGCSGETWLYVVFGVLRRRLTDYQCCIRFGIATNNSGSDSTHFVMHGHRFERTYRTSCRHGLFVVVFWSHDDICTNFRQTMNRAVYHQPYEPTRRMTQVVYSGHGFLTLIAAFFYVHGEIGRASCRERVEVEVAQRSYK